MKHSFDLHFVSTLRITNYVILTPSSFKYLFRKLKPSHIFQYQDSTKFFTAKMGLDDDFEHIFYYFYYEHIPHLVHAADNSNFKNFFETILVKPSSRNADPDNIDQNGLEKSDAQALMKSIGESIFGTSHINQNKSSQEPKFSSQAQELIYYRQKIQENRNLIEQGDLSLQKAAHLTQEIGDLEEKIRKILDS